MPTQNQILYRHLLYMLIVTIPAMMVVEYLAWNIIQSTTETDRFPGFFSAEVLSDILINTAGAFLFGYLFLFIAQLSLRYRKKRLQSLHKPFWAGLLFFNLYMMAIVFIGLGAIN